MALLCDIENIEQLVWQDIQSEGGFDSGPGCSEPEQGKFCDRVHQGHQSSSPLSSATDLAVASAQLQRAAADSGSASMAGQVGAAGEGAVQPSHDDDVGPFAALESHQRLESAPSMHLQSMGSSPLHPNRSLVTYKTRALAAAAGSLRTGAVGSGLRFAAFMARSNSGGLADTLMSEHARAASGLLTGGLGRCDSLPELSLLAPSTGDLADLVSLRDLDFLAGMPSAAGVPSLSMLFGERPDFGTTVPAAGAQQDQQDPLPAAAATDSVLQAAGAEAPCSDAPAWLGSRILGRPASFTANGAAALFSAGNLPLSRPSFCGLPPREPVAAPAASPFVSQGQGLKPPSLVDYSQMLMPAAPAAVPAPAEAAVPAPEAVAAGLGAGGFEGFSLASFGRGPHPFTALQALQMDRQDTFELLMRQVDQELVAAAEIKQYAALELSTMDIPMPAQAAPAPPAEAAAAATADASAYASMAQLAAAELAAAAAAAEGSAAGQQAKRRSVFEGQTVLLPADASAVSSATAAGAAVLEPVGPSFHSWAAPSTSSQASGASAVAAMGPVPGTGTAGVASSPFCLPVSTGLLVGGGRGNSTPAASEAEHVLGKQEVARYSRLITCKTYLKRLNITQPMAEHLLPLHDLTLPSKRRRSSNDGAGSDGDEDAPKRGTYEQMFKEQIVIVDEAGATFRVQYEGVTCNAQKHLRLTCGWRDFIKQHNVEIGDTIVFERRGDERSVIYVTVVKACDAPVEPEPKKRRVSRKQAVQCLG